MGGKVSIRIEVTLRVKHLKQNVHLGSYGRLDWLSGKVGPDTEELENPRL